MTKKGADAHKEKSTKKRHKAGSFRTKSHNDTASPKTQPRQFSHELILGLLGFILGATLISFIFLAKHSLKDIYEPLDTPQGQYQSLSTTKQQADFSAQNTAVNVDAVNDYEANTDDASLNRETDTQQENSYGIAVSAGTSDGVVVQDITQGEVQSDNSVIATEAEGTNSTKTTTPEKTQKTFGQWSLVLYNKEQFNLEDAGDNVGSIEFDNVCGKNRGVTTFCKNTSKLRKTTASTLGKQKCGGGGACRIGQSCLLWNAVTEDDGDVELKTAVYTCA